MNLTDGDGRRNGEVAAGAPAPEAAPETADVVATGGGMRDTGATEPDQPAPRPVDLVASAPTPKRTIVAVAVAAVAGLLVVRWLWRRRP
jgi:hypothetical protein